MQGVLHKETHSSILFMLSVQSKQQNEQLVVSPPTKSMYLQQSVPHFVVLVHPEQAFVQLQW